MGFRSPMGGLYGGYMNAQAHNLKRDQLDMAQQQMDAKNQQANARAQADLDKMLQKDVEMGYRLLTTGDDATRPLALNYLLQKEQQWGPRWSRELRASNFVPQVPVASASAAGGAPNPNVQGPPDPRPQTQPKWAIGPDGFYQQDPMFMQGYPTSASAKAAKEGRDANFMDSVGGQYVNDFVQTFTGGDMNKWGSLLRNPVKLSAALETQKGYWRAAGMPAEEIDKHATEIWKQSQDILAGDRSDSAESRALRGAIDDSRRLAQGDASAINARAALLFGGRVTNGLLDMSTIMSGKMGEATQFMQRASRYVDSGKNVLQAMMQVQDEMGIQRSFGKMPERTPDQSEEDYSRSMEQWAAGNPSSIAAANLGGNLPGSALQPAEAERFPWDTVYPNLIARSYMTDQGAYMVVYPDPAGSGSLFTDFIPADDVVNYVKKSEKGFKWDPSQNASFRSRSQNGRDKIIQAAQRGKAK